MRQRKKTSPIWQGSKEELEQVIAQSNTYADVLHHFGLSERTGGNYKTLKHRCKVEEIDLIALKQRSDDYGVNRAKKMAAEKRTIPLEDILVENSNYGRQELKQRLIKANLLENECANCKVGPIWDDKPLMMVLDHINGINNDHRIENLRLLCPNCNSQTSTFSGRNCANKTTTLCLSCGTKISKQSHHCHTCASLKFNKRKVEDRPSKEQLQKDIEQLSWCAIGRKYGVSDNTIKKWAKAYKLIERVKGVGPSQ